MIKATVTLILSATAVLGIATQADEIINAIVPSAAASVSDTNLQTVATQAQAYSYLNDVSLDKSVALVVSELGTEGIRYSVSGLSVVAETDWSCRRLTFGEFFSNISDC